MRISQAFMKYKLILRQLFPSSDNSEARKWILD